MPSPKMMPSPKTSSPLGSTVADYVAGRAFLRARLLPLSAALSALFLAPLLGPGLLPPRLTATLGAPVYQVLCGALGLLSLAAVCVSLYGLQRIGAWLPSVPEPCYEFVHGADGAVVRPPPGLPLPERAAWEVAFTSELSAREGLALRAKYSDRLGNNLFQYAHARLRAAFLDLAFEAPPLGGPFGGVALRVGRHGSSASGSTSGAPPSCRHAQQLRSVGGQRWQAAWHAWLQEPSCRYAMNTRQFAGFEATVAGWFRPSLDALLLQAGAGAAASPAVPDWRPGDVAVHVRVGDILWGHHAAYRPLPMEFYWGALRSIAARQGGAAGGGRLGRVVLLAEGSSSSGGSGGGGAGSGGGGGGGLVQRMAAALREGQAQRGLEFTRGVEVRMGGTVAEDLLALYTAPALVLSVSSFSWWPAFLSRHARAIVLPQWGLLLPHSWLPSPLDYPQFSVVQCMALAAAPVPEEGAGAGGEGAAAEAAALHSRGAAIGAALQSLQGGAVFASASSTVVEVPLPDLPCWSGNTQAAIDGLF
jgi:hypothetical protein